jgi:membrane protein implicated in regulation of membrane protease activity
VSFEFPLGMSFGLGIAILVAAALAEVGEFLLWRRFLDRYRVVTGAEGLVGERAVVTEPCDPDGRVRLRGELLGGHQLILLQRAHDQPRFHGSTL